MVVISINSTDKQEEKPDENWYNVPQSTPHQAVHFSASWAPSWAGGVFIYFPPENR